MPFLQEYTMLDELGRGGFATVYKVRHNELGYIRAVRVLNETVVDANNKTIPFSLNVTIKNNYYETNLFNF